jgi:hypothetical protein
VGAGGFDGRPQRRALLRPDLAEHAARKKIEEEPDHGARCPRWPLRSLSARERVSVPDGWLEVSSVSA